MECFVLFNLFTKIFPVLLINAIILEWDSLAKLYHALAKTFAKLSPFWVENEARWASQTFCGALAFSFAHFLAKPRPILGRSFALRHSFLLCPCSLDSIQYGYAWKGPIRFHFAQVELKCHQWGLLTWITRHRWQSEARSKPCFSAQESTRLSLFSNLRPHALVQRPRWDSSTNLLKSHMLMKWNSWEKTWMVSAALTLHLRSKDMAEESVYSTSDILGRLPL